MAVGAGAAASGAGAGGRSRLKSDAKNGIRDSAGAFVAGWTGRLGVHSHALHSWPRAAGQTD